MKLRKLSKTDKAEEKPKRVIYGGTLYHGESFSLSRRLFGHSPNVRGKRNHSDAVYQHKKAKGRFLRVSTNEFSTVVGGSIEESIKEVGLYPVSVVVERPDGKAEEWLVTE